MNVTIKDVAKKARVSIATVSRAINHNGYVNQETANRVAQAIAATGYKIPQHHLPAQQTNLVEVILPSISNPLYAEFFEQISINLTNQGYETALRIDNNSQHEIKPYLDRLHHGKIAGIITSSQLKIAEQEADWKLPIVSFDRHLDKVTLIHCNNLDGGYQIAEKVLSLGKKKILILSGNRDDLYPLNNRIKGMLSVFNHYKVDVTTSYIDFESSIMVKKIQIAQILDQKEYDAICCTDDITALLVKNYADSADYHLLITGFDGSDFIRSIFPDLITIKQPIDDIANLMCEILLKKIKHPSKHFEKQYVFPVTLLD